ncbi:MAG: hypothetical protein IJ867_05215 [Clostridia bacterium]|nr:hypothetical protein [Clostridia bacterium]
MSESNDFKKFLLDHKGAIIGGLVGIIIACTKLVNILIPLIVIIFGIWLGNYIQKNKDNVKETLKKWIDKF